MGKTLPIRAAIDVSPGDVATFARRWGITELALFGSILRDDFRADSDVDVLVKFGDNARPNLDGWMRMREELAGLFHREVDLVDRDSIERSINWYRKRIILDSAEVLYAA
jgi:predicted nucleotidyltransferase